MLTKWQNADEIDGGFYPLISKESYGPSQKLDGLGITAVLIFLVWSLKSTRGQMGTPKQAPLLGRSRIRI